MLDRGETMAGSTTINGVHFEWFVQSGVCIRGGAVLYVDPHLIRDGEKADLILITHDHFDHLDIASIRALAKDDTVIVANACCVSQLQGKVAGRVMPIGEGQTVSEKGVDVRAVAGYNYIHPRGSNVGFVFSLRGQTIYHAGDTDHIPEMASLGRIDIALLPIGGTYTMDEQEAAEAVKVIRPKVVIPIHYGYGTGGDPQKFASLVGAAARVVILDEVQRAAA
jgi:L-ascorbate metabolism protein UlaG (beta-lactamase superfamily)